MGRISQFLAVLFGPAMALLAPISRVMAPLLDGFLRRLMLAFGAEMRECKLLGCHLCYYHRAASRPGLARVSALLARRSAPAGADTRVPIVLVHGLGDNALTWTMTMALLASGRDIYAVDLPGYGMSTLAPGHLYATISEMSEVLAAFIGQVVGRPALVVGNSMGGWIAVRLAASAPGLVREITLVNAGGAYLEGRPSWEPFRSVVGVADLSTTRQAIRQVLGLAPALLIYLGQYSIQERFQCQVVRAFVEAADERDFLTADELRALPVPASIIWGLRDQFLPSGSLEFFMANLPGAPVLTINRCGHLPQRERPLAVARFIDGRAAHLDGAAFQRDPHLRVSGDVLQ
jgi:pimeloyl-ACP methyl ester carboxylesterase